MDGKFLLQAAMNFTSHDWGRVDHVVAREAERMQ